MYYLLPTHNFILSYIPSNCATILSRWYHIYLSLPQFLSDPGKPGVRSLGPDVRPSVTETPCADLTDVTLADEDTNSIPTDNANMAIQGNVTMQVTQPGGQSCN